MGKEETRSAVKERGATALTIRGRAWPFLGLGGFGRQGGGGPVDSGKQLATRSLGKGEICRRLKPLRSSPTSYLSFHLHLYLFTTDYYYTILSYSPNPTLLPKTTRNPREKKPGTGHTLKFPSRSNPNGRPASHTCDRHAANLLRFVHGLIGFRDGGDFI